MKSNLGFWKKLKKPILALAPMADVTDSAFRQVILKRGKPSIFFTWFVSADGLSSKKGKKNLLKDLYFTESERPIVAQIFGAKPENIFQAAKLVKKLGFDGLDINMGCPDKKILKQGAGGALIKNPALAKEIILAAQKGAGNLPISVKTRLGFDSDILNEWLLTILKTNPAAITIHARTVKELSGVPARWERIGEAVKIRNKYKSNALIIGNGDVKDLKDAFQKAKKYKADGIMLGRSAFGNPWIFNEKIKKENLSREKIFQALLEHALLFKKIYPRRNFAVMKKHFASYISGFSGAKEIRSRLMESKTASESVSVLKSFLERLK
ncbi:MAG: hypothetical protein A2604_00845 [Candidatus Liptonbacteria bacterium RIFOXYD1_FULL_36_11]|uniref:tRNA-dihydrouridine synthase n=1 Tax=Candidatus Liptonbacteria bacterium RIFOXYD1_FULL_36_11 TaxID=1798656 RepID=A0A1G2CSX4_9BACT|nr:MAG: hypothetical protein A2604_00845 [Candidatus Liptonbacteria bacterium RIFOXYD1_FULL_36_11]